MLTLTKYNDPKYISEKYNQVEKYEGIDKRDITSLEAVLECEDKKANLFITFITLHVNHFNGEQRENQIRSSQIDYSPLKEYYPIEILKLILLKTTQYVNMDTEYAIYKMYPYLKLIDAIKHSPWQWYYDNDISSDIVENIYNQLTNPTTPFGDDRFKAVPINANCYRSGNSTSEWLSKEQGGMNHYYNKETDSVYLKRDEDCFRSIFIDAKIGLVIFFKNKPSITISFNYDGNKNIYIHQVQAQIKDRGHYKIKGDWKLATIDYLQSLFPDFKLHLISGRDISTLVRNGYKKDETPDCLMVTKETLSKIQKNYDNIMPDCKKMMKKGEINYRSLSA